MSRRKICIVTTSRADFGLLRGLFGSVKADPALQLQVIASGMHLAAKFGSTLSEIEAAGVHVDWRVDMQLKGTTDLANVKSIGHGVMGFADALAELKPALVVLLGDRFELLAAASAALVLKIPLAHIHGGERSEGAIDEAVRHAITKMAALHFPATETYRRRIIQMGEPPDRVFNFGAPGLDQIYATPLFTRAELEQELGLSLQAPVALVTYHPALLEGDSVDAQVDQLTQALQASRLNAVCTMANADAQGARINTRLRAWCGRTPVRFKWLPHLGHRRYLSCLRHCTVMVGNSSSGLTEAPSFKLPVVNIGDRQRGRLRAANVIDVPCSCAGILRGLSKACSRRFRESLRHLRNPYDRHRDGRASERIKEVLKHVVLSEELLKKSFYDCH